jgi:multimeric flavodoxin WrbA
MKITIFYSSIHKTRGNTYVIVDQFAEGAREAGAEVDVVLLAKQKIKNCMACLNCWTKTPGKCSLKDDMSELLEKVMGSDLVVLATPVYNHNVNGIMKTFLDRLTPLIDPHLIKMDNGYTGHFKRHEKYPDLGLIATGGFPEQKCCEFVSSYINKLAIDLYSKVVFEIHRGEAILLQMGENSPVAPIVDDYKATVRRAGAEVVQNYEISTETADKLNQLLIPEEIYIDQANKYWDSRIAHFEAKKK